MVHTAPVTTAAPTISARIHSLNRPNLVSVGTIVWLSSELMLFAGLRSEEHTSELQSPCNLVCRLLLEKKKTQCTTQLPRPRRTHHHRVRVGPALPARRADRDRRALPRHLLQAPPIHPDHPARRPSVRP